MKSVLIIGLGRFGRHMAKKLSENGNEVLAIDNNESRVNAAMSFATEVQIGDATNEAYIKSLGVRNFDICICAIGDNFQSSLEATSLLKENGAPMVISRASRDVHKKFLLRNGADKVVYPERELAEHLAVKCSYDNIFDYIELTHEYAIYEIPVPKTWAGQTILKLAIRTKYHISILATKKDSVVFPLPKPEHVFEVDEDIIILGKNDDVMKIIKM